MKLPRHAFQTYWDVHAWSGAIAAIVLNAMFFAGVFALFHEEIALWQDPRAHHAPGVACRDAQLEPLVASALERVAFPVRNVFVSVHEGACAPITIDLRGAEAHQRRVVIGDARSGEVLRAVVDGLGTAGGHDKRAGGAIPLTDAGPDAIDVLLRLLRQRLLEQLGRAEVPGRRLLQSSPVIPMP